MDYQSSPQRPRQPRIADRDRKRAARACDSCRRQKEKCDGGIPCRRCCRLGKECEFSQRPGQAGLRSSPRLSRGASRRASTPGHQDADPARRLDYLERIAQRCAGHSRVLDMEALKHLAETETAEGRPRPPRPAASVSSQGSDSDRVDDKFSVEPVHENITHYSGEFSHWNFSMRIKKWIDQGVHNDNLNQPDGSITNFKEYYRAEELQSPAVTLASLSRLPPRAISEFLINCFFAHAEANYCFVEKNWLKTKLDLVYDSPCSLTRRDVGVVCMIFSLLAIGTQYAYLEMLAEGTSRLSASQAPAPGSFSEDAVGILFYQQASRLLSDVMTVSSLECVQACLLLGIYTLPIDASGLSYIYLSLALKLAIQNGMHRRYSGTDLDAATCETRNRVWWTIYTIEKRVGIFHGRPTSISQGDVDADYPSDNAQAWPSSEATHNAQILATLHLNQKLDRLSREITMLRTCPKADMNDGLARLVELQYHLEDWWNSLPDEVACKEATAITSTARGSLHLKLEYCLVRMFVGRVFILPQLGQGDSSSISMSASSPRASSHASRTRKRLRATLVSDCVKAAMLVIDTCRAIRNSVGLARASYTEFSSCRAALLVITTQCLQQRTYPFRQSLRDGLSMLKEMSSGSESAHSEMSLIQAFERAIANLYSADQGCAQSTRGSEYMRFQRWQQSWKKDPLGLSLPEEGVVAPTTTTTTTTTNFDPSDADEGAHDMLYPASCTPFFGVDGTFASFPQNPEDLSAFFGADFASGHDFEAG